MKVLSAFYGNKDVTDLVRNKVKNNSLYLKASNDLFGDPQSGVKKYFKITIQNNEDVSTFDYEENSFVNLPKTKNKRLGIFYTNNNDNHTYPCINFSLKCIQKSASDIADIVTNVWCPIPDNPFIETIAWTNTSSHLNQTLQILQCLYTARAINNYDFVSFLEHDVLYPEGYFDYPSFDINCICNTNYIGMNKNGFQSKNANHQPLSQLTMKMDFAIKHFESILPNAILTNSGLVEPKEISDWSCKNPSVHVNHGKHFTSHFTIYSKNTIENNDYWGNINKYSNLFFEDKR